MKNFIGLLILILLNINALFNAQIKEHIFIAGKATEGVGLHKEKIWWINWENLKNKNLKDGVEGTFTSPSGYIYHITLDKASHGEYLYAASTNDYTENNFKNAYNTFKNGDETITDLLGLTNQNKESKTDNDHGSGTTVKFKLTIQVEDPLTKVKTNPKGFVISGTESLSGTSEHYSLTAPDTSSMKVIDKYLNKKNDKEELDWSKFSITLNVSEQDSLKTLKAIGNGGNGRGDLMLYAENTSYVDIELKGEGYQHIALGFIEQLDYNDTPSSNIVDKKYGSALHYLDTKFTGNSIENGTYTLDGSKDEGKLSNVEESSKSKLNSYWSTYSNPLYMMLGDKIGADSNIKLEDDDDSIPTDFNKLNQYFILKYNNETSLPGYIYMWVDENQNGFYDDHEKVIFPINAEEKSSVLVDLKKYYSLIVENQYHIRLRVSSAANLGPTGFAPDGEVEDYVFEIANIPNDIAGTVFFDTDGGIPNGEPAKDIEVRLTKIGDPNFLEVTKTNVEGKYLFFNQLAGTYIINIIKPANVEHVSSTDDTPLDGKTMVSIISGSEKNVTNIDFGINAEACFRPPSITGDKLPTTHGITILDRKENTLNGWPYTINGAWTTIEAKTKGLVLNRVEADKESDGGQVPKIANPVEGMIIYDTTNHCLKIYNGSSWKCFNKLGCPQN